MAARKRKSRFENGCGGECYEDNRDHISRVTLPGEADHGNAEGSAGRICCHRILLCEGFFSGGGTCPCKGAGNPKYIAVLEQVIIPEYKEILSEFKKRMNIGEQEALRKAIGVFRDEA